MDIGSDFAILDIKKGRKKLAKHFASTPAFGPCPEELRIPVTIRGYIGDVWGNDDGTSQEFNVTVEKLMTVTDQEKLRAEIAEVLEMIAKDGLPGPRDLDVALDAIFCSFGTA